MIALLVLQIDAFGQKFAVGTNALDWIDMGTMNIEAGYAVSRHFTVVADAKYNPWTYNSGDKETQVERRQRTFSAGMRYWPWHVYSGWWIGAKGRYQEYNRGGVLGRETEEGDSYGGVLDFGYTLMLSKNFNLEFGGGVFTGGTKFKRYACPVCGRVTGSGEEFFILPADLSVSIVLII